jgi:hypothetical protein
LGGPASTSLTVNTDASGNAQAYYAGPASAGITNSVQIAVGSLTTNVNEITAATSGDVAAPTGVTNQVGTSAGEVVVRVLCDQRCGLDRVA